MNITEHFTYHFITVMAKEVVVWPGALFVHACKSRWTGKTCHITTLLCKRSANADMSVEHPM